MRTMRNHFKSKPLLLPSWRFKMLNGKAFSLVAFTNWKQDRINNERERSTSLTATPTLKQWLDYLVLFFVDPTVTIVILLSSRCSCKTKNTCTIVYWAINRNRSNFIVCKIFYGFNKNSNRFFLARKSKTVLNSTHLLCMDSGDSFFLSFVTLISLRDHKCGIWCTRRTLQMPFSPLTIVKQREKTVNSSNLFYISVVMHCKTDSSETFFTLCIVKNGMECNEIPGTYL